MEFPDGMTIAQGRFTLRQLLRGEPRAGLWSAAEEDRDLAAWVTLRFIRPISKLTQILNFSSFGIEAPLYLGRPDIEEKHREDYFCVVDAVPSGTALARLGRLSARDAAQLGVKLCDVVASWASTSDGMILSGLHPETVFLDEQHRFAGAVPRPHYLLGFQYDYYGYPNISFDPPGHSALLETRDAVFTIGLLVWWAICAVQPYYIHGTDYETNEFDDRRMQFDGPAALGRILDQVLVSDPAKRMGLDELRAALATLTASHENIQ